jgi:hypothetical protein
MQRQNKKWHGAPGVNFFDASDSMRHVGALYGHFFPNTLQVELGIARKALQNANRRRRAEHGKGRLFDADLANAGGSGWQGTRGRDVKEEAKPGDSPVRECPASLSRRVAPAVARREPAAAGCPMSCKFIEPVALNAGISVTCFTFGFTSSSTKESLSGILTITSICD